MPFLIFLIALLYASVGLGGGSGYLALMGLFNVDPNVMKPTALALNILVTTIGTYKYSRAGYFSWKLFWPFAITSIPFAFLGGRLNLNGDIYVDFTDFSIFAESWMKSGENLQGDINESGKVDLEDLIIFSDDWLN